MRIHPSHTLSPDIHRPPAGWKVRYDKCFALLVDRAEKLMTQLVRLQSLQPASTFVLNGCGAPSRRNDPSRHHSGGVAPSTSVCHTKAVAASGTPWQRSCPRKQAFGPRKQVCSGPARTPTDSLSEPATTDLPTSGYPHGMHMILGAWDFAVTSCLRPAARDPSPTTSSTQNLTEFETLKRTFHDTANRCHQNGLRFTAFVSRQWFSTDTPEAGGTQSAISSPESPSISAPPPTALQATSISKWVSASPRHCIVIPRVSFYDVHRTASTDTPTTLGPDDPDPDTWSTECDSSPDLSDDVHDERKTSFR